MSQEASAISLLKKFEEMQSARQAFERDWRSIQDYVRPVTVEYNEASGKYVSAKPETMYDGTAPDSLEELASALHSYLTNPSERWFELQIEGADPTVLPPEILGWLEGASEAIYAHYRREGAGLNGALHEAYMDLGSYGTAVVSQEWDNVERGFLFRAEPLTSCYLLENNRGKVDTLYRMLSWTVRQCRQEFGELPYKLNGKKEDDTIQVLHCVYPRTDRISGVAPPNMRYASIWICVDTKELLRESGYETFPYHVPRWTKLAGEFYGRSPAKRCLPDIRMLNKMEQTLIKAGQKAVDPPLVLANEGFMLPIRTSPGSLIFKEDEERQITPLHFEGNLPWGEEKAEQKRDFIRRCFYNDWIRREKKRREQSATEIVDDRDEMLRLFAPVFGRLVAELHGPMIARSYYMLNQRGKIPRAPDVLRSQTLTVGFLSPAARAQTGSRAGQISQYVQDLIPLAQIDPTIMDVIDWDKAAAELAIARGTPRRILRTPEEMEVIRKQRQAMQQAQQIASVAEPASKAVKNLADAGVQL